MVSTSIRIALVSTLLTTGCLASGSAGFGLGAAGGGTAGGPAASGPAGNDNDPTATNVVIQGDGTGAKAADPEPKWDDYQFAVRERSGTYYAPWIMQKLTTFKVSDACYAKMADKDSGALNNSSYYVRNVVDLAKKWTTNDWDHIEGQRSDHKKDRKLVEPMINEFASRFHMTIYVEGDDCEVERDAYWIRDWYTIGEAFAAYPPSAGKLTIHLNVVAAARDITVKVDEDTGTFTITAPRDFEAKDWTEKLAKPFRKNAKTL